MIGHLCLDAHLTIRCQHMGICARSARHTNLRVSMRVPLSILYLLIINLMEFLIVWAKHNFYYITYISVYIQPRYFYLISRSVNGNNMNRVILHSERPSFRKSGCEISVPWWWIWADRGMITSVWSRDRDTGDTSEHTPVGPNKIPWLYAINTDSSALLPPDLNNNWMTEWRWLSDLVMWQAEPLFDWSGVEYKTWTSKHICCSWFV